MEPNMAEFPALHNGMLPVEGLVPPPPPMERSFGELSKENKNDLVFVAPKPEVSDNEDKNEDKRIEKHGERCEVCEICGLIFTRKDHLRRHLRTHTADRPHQCPECNMNFARKDALTRHMAKHIDYKPYGCFACQDTFSRQDHRARHIRRKHPGVELMVSMTRKSTAPIKKRNDRPIPKPEAGTGAPGEQTKSQRIQCQYCEKWLSRKDHLRRHIAKKHPM